MTIAGRSGPFTWHILTGEYPPAVGGVAAYTAAVAEQLVAQGDEVHVWVPRSGIEPPPSGSAVVIHSLPDHFGRRGRQLLDESIRASERPIRVLVQYVPHAFGLRAMNVPFCLWLFRWRQFALWIMFHEVAFPLERGQPFKHRVLAIVNRVMAGLVARAADRILVSTSGWVPLVRRLAGPGGRIEVAPVPSNVPVVRRGEHRDAVRARLAPAHHQVIGHFGTYGSLITRLLLPTIELLLRDHTERVMVLVGAGSESFARDVAVFYPQLAGRIRATGTLSPSEISACIDACDVMVQPYPGGACTRRGSLMAALAHGAAIVTTNGRHTEPLWEETTAVVLAGEAPDSIAAAVERVLDSSGEQQQLRARARRLYSDCFDLGLTIARLRT